jgi:uncharacterized protein (TIGR03067 family)
MIISVEQKMKTFALAIGLALCPGLSVRAADEKIDLSGKYVLVSGKKNGADVGEKAKKATYTATADTFTIANGDMKFEFSYKLKPGTTPVEIDMSLVSGPEGAPKGALAVGIVETKGDVLKLAYSLDKEKRPKDFEGKAGYYIELKKAK